MDDSDEEDGYDDAGLDAVMAAEREALSTQKAKTTATLGQQEDDEDEAMMDAMAAMERRADKGKGKLPTSPQKTASPSWAKHDSDDDERDDDREGKHPSILIVHGCQLLSLRVRPPQNVK